MKKIIWFFGLLSLIGIFSYKEINDDGNKTKSFSEIIQLDKSRIKELLTTADSVRQKLSQSQLPIKLTDSQVNRMRKDMGRNIKLSAGDPPLIKVKIKDLQEIIEMIPHQTANDKLIFYLATYRSQSDFDRYEERARAQGHSPKDILHVPTLLITWESQSDGKLQTVIGSGAWDVGEVHPPPYNVSLKKK